MDTHTYSFIYQYGVMLVIFLVGLRLTRRSERDNPVSYWRRPSIWLLVGGFVYFVLLQGFFQFVAPQLGGH